MKSLQSNQAYVRLKVGRALLQRNTVSYGGTKIMAPRVCQSVGERYGVMGRLKSFEADG